MGAARAQPEAAWAQGAETKMREETERCKGGAAILGNTYSYVNP